MSPSTLDKSRLTPYFAYGSNLDTDQMTRRCPNACKGSKATLSGYRFIINCNGVASVIPDPASKVEGLVWWLTSVDEKNLDRWEGVDKGCYVKKYPDVTKRRGSTLHALAYIAKDEVIGKPREGYLEIIIRNTKKLRFPQKYIEYLEGL